MHRLADNKYQDKSGRDTGRSGSEQKTCQAIWKLAFGLSPSRSILLASLLRMSTPPRRPQISFGSTLYDPGSFYYTASSRGITLKAFYWRLNLKKVKNYGPKQLINVQHIYASTNLRPRPD